MEWGGRETGEERTESEISKEPGVIEKKNFNIA